VRSAPYPKMPFIHPDSSVVGRLAPSPTGGLHLGHARTFLIAWLAARQAQGKIILRIEDLDASRVRAEAAEMALTDLKWLGLDWDEGPYVQSERGELYDQSLKRLKADEHAYPCTCAHRTAAEALALGDRPFAWRFRVPAGPVCWNDLFLGQVAMEPDRLG